MSSRATSAVGVHLSPQGRLRRPYTASTLNPAAGCQLAFAFQVTPESIRLGFGWATALGVNLWSSVRTQCLASCAGDRSKNPSSQDRRGAGIFRHLRDRVPQVAELKRPFDYGAEVEDHAARARPVPCWNVGPRLPNPDIMGTAPAGDATLSTLWLDKPQQAKRTLLKEISDPLLRYTN